MTAKQPGAGPTSWSIGNAISTASAILFGHFGPFFGTALVASVPSLVFDYLLPGSYFRSIANFIIGQMVSVTLVYGAMQALRGQRVTIGECLSEGLKRLGAALGVAILFGIAVLLGLVLLIVPGLIFGTIWAVAVPAAVIERRNSTASLSRSQELTSGRRWRVFGAYVMALLVMWVGAMVTEGVLAVITGLRSPVTHIGLWAFSALFEAFTACLLTTLYYYLRREKEGVDINQIATVFD